MLSDQFLGLSCELEEAGVAESDVEGVLLEPHLDEAHAFEPGRVEVRGDLHLFRKEASVVEIRWIADQTDPGIENGPLCDPDRVFR